ncbi:MAG TPA: hypothetical protein VMX97_06965 [Hyphomicrobiaceae bacterium]|nr:hypothetical protein [Hyphomicrobiaceae bacterium]
MPREEPYEEPRLPYPAFCMSATEELASRYTYDLDIPEELRRRAADEHDDP